MMEKLIITAAICGAEVTKENSPAVPYTVEEMVREAKSAYDAGAAVIHVHVRWDDGTPTQDRERFRVVLDAIKEACPGVTIREDALLDMLADMLQDALDTALGQYTLSLAELPRQAADRAELREKITSRKQEIQRLRGIVRSLYENLVQGVLTKDEYFDYKEKYESRIADLAVEMEQLEDGLRTMDAQTKQHRALKQDAAQIKTDRALTGALIERLIDRIEVSHNKQITVRYRFQSEFETYAEVLEQCRNM